MRNHYELLQVPRDASADEIQHAYRALALQYHPDRNSAPDAAARMTAINTAYEVLRDPLRRREYDLLLTAPACAGELAQHILAAAREVIMRGAWSVLEDSGTTMVLEHARQRVRIVFMERAGTDQLRRLPPRLETFLVVLAVSAEEPMRPAAGICVIDLIQTRLHGAALPDGPCRKLLSAFL